MEQGVVGGEQAIGCGAEGARVLEGKRGGEGTPREGGRMLISGEGG